MMTNYYKTNLQQLQEELKRIDLLIDLQIAKFRQENKIMNEFQGVYISDEEVDSLLDPDSLNAVNEEYQATTTLKSHLIQLESEISQKIVKSLEKGIKLRLPSLANIFDLSPFEIDCILVCLAPALDRKYEKLYAYLNDDITKKHPTVDLVLNLLCSSTEDKIHSRRHFDTSEHLFKHNLISFVGEGTENILSRFIKVDDRIINYTLGINFIDARIEPYCKLVRPQADLNELIMQDGLKTQVKNIINSYSEVKSKYFTYLLQGSYGAGKKTITQGICKELNKEILALNIETLMKNEANFEGIIQLVFREALLRDSAVYLDNFERLYTEDYKNTFYRNILFKSLEDFKGITFIASKESIELDEGQNNLFKIEIEKPNYNTRKELWETSLDEKISAKDIVAISNKFKFTPGQIKDAIESGKRFAALEGRQNLTSEDLYNGCKDQSSQKLSSLAKKIKPNYKWKDLILPPDNKEQLTELINYIKNKGTVYQDWGFDKRLSLGKGLNISFSGTSGTGKTMAAEVIASKLNLDLYKVDLSMVVSKYIGETEKNLNKIFDAAEESNAILFFDEADALFGKRSEVRDSHDRYANIEISYLLQKMEENQGIVILATNLSQNIDGAFLRRMHFTIEFPFPSAECRLKIWKILIPEKAPVADDINFDFLANNFQLAGGNIKNIIVNAAFYAAEDSGIINMEHIVRSIRREYQKIGKVCSQSDFGEYYELIS